MFARQVTVANKCLAIVMQRSDGNGDRQKHRKTVENGFTIFQDFQAENGSSFWAPSLVQSINSLEFVGFVRPGTLFVSGNQLHLECLRTAWARRILKPPNGFTIKRLGDVDGIEMHEVPQTQFVPLPEVLCLLISNLNRLGEPATFSKIVTTLGEEYEGMTVPNREVLYATLGALIAEGKLCCMGEHYFIQTPTMFNYYQQQYSRRQPFSNCLWPKEQELMLAVTHQMHSNQSPPFRQETCSRECQTGASVVNAPACRPNNKKDQATTAKSKQEKNSAKLPECKDKQKRQTEEKRDGKENKGFLSRLFGRKSKNNQPKSDPITQPCTSNPSSTSGQPAAPPMATFSAQFPPPEWMCDPKFLKQKEHTQQAFFSKIIRNNNNNEKEFVEPLSANLNNNNNNNNNNNAKNRHSVWIDPIDCNKVRRHEHRSSHRYSKQQRYRMSKYLSSSSECLREPAYKAYKTPLIDERRRSHRHPSNAHKDPGYHHNHHNHHNYQQQQQQQQHVLAPHRQMSDERCRMSPEDLMAAGHQQQLPVELQRSTGSKRGAKGPVVVSRIPPLALPTDGEPEMSGKETGHSASTPLKPPSTPNRAVVSPRRHRSPTPTPTPTPEPTPDISPDSDKQLPAPVAVQQPLPDLQRDSAYSDSPVVTEMSSSDGKYSTWSGSDNNQSSVSPRPEQVVSDNTYVNHTLLRRALDHTYENLDVGQDGTIYENEDEQQPCRLSDAALGQHCLQSQTSSV